MIKTKNILFLLLLAPALQADPIVTFFFRDYPSESNAQHALQKLRKPQAIAKRSLQGLALSNPKAGIFSTYYGFLGVSDYMGQTSFPRKQSKGAITVYISNRISPIMMFKNTVSHWELAPGTPAKAYTLNLEEDPSTKLLVWVVNEAEINPNGQIPGQDSLLIIAKPSNVYVPLGATLSSQDANLKLPDMYVKKGIATTRNALYMLNLTFLFRPVDELFKIEKKRFGSLIQE